MSTSEDWAELVETYRLADTEVNEAMSIVTKKFQAIANGESSANPTQAEFNRWEAANEKRNAIQKSMDEYILLHFRQP